MAIARSRSPSRSKSARVDAEADVRLRGFGDPGGEAPVEKDAVAAVRVQSVGFAVEVSHDEVVEAVRVDVADGDAHAGLGLASVGERRAGEQRIVDEAKSAVRGPVQEVEVGVHVVGDVDIRPAVAVEIGDDDAQAGAARTLDPGGGRRVGEGRVSPLGELVAVEAVLKVLVDVRMAVASPAGFLHAADPCCMS